MKPCGGMCVVLYSELLGFKREREITPLPEPSLMFSLHRLHLQPPTFSPRIPARRLQAELRSAEASRRLGALDLPQPSMGLVDGWQGRVEWLRWQTLDGLDWLTCIFPHPSGRLAWLVCSVSKRCEVKSMKEHVSCMSKQCSCLVVSRII